MNSLRLAYICMHTSPAEVPGSRDAGGMNVVVRAQAEALAELGHHVDIYTRRSDASVPDAEELAPGVWLHQLTAGPTQPLPKSEIDAYIDDFREALRRVERADVVHSHHWMSGVAAVDVAREWGVPHVQSYHSIAASPGAPLSEGEPPESPGREPGERWTATESDALVAVSAAEAHTIIGRLGAEPEHVQIVAPGVDTDVFRPRDEGAPPTVVFAARLQPLKAPDVVLEALALIPQDARPTLLMVGDVSQDFASYRAELDALVDRLGIGPWVQFVPPLARPDLSRVLGEAQIALVPSYSETFGLIALEAEACGTPVIAAASGGLGEAVLDGQTGVLLRSHEPAVWAEAIQDLLQDAPRRERLGHVARAHARRLSWAASAGALSHVYANVKASHR